MSHKAEVIESIEVPEISPATRKDFLPISSRSDRTVINPYVIRAKNIQEDNFIDFQNFDYSAYRKLLAFLSRYRSYVLEPTAGSGSFAINCAREKKTVGFILIEKRFKRSVRALEKSKLLGLKNIFCLRGKFEDFVPFLPKNFFQVVYLAFPDPWMKEKWSQNRIYEEVKTLHDLVAHNGFLVLKTDQHHIINRIMVNFLGVLRIMALSFFYVEPRKCYRTDFEKMFLAKHIGVHALFMIKPCISIE